VAAAVIGGALVGWVPAPLVAPAQPAGADPAVDCSAGVIVAVNFAQWSNPVNTVCDLAPLPATAAYALSRQTAGFSPTGVATYGLAFICQIDDDPPDDSCQSTPPANAYWSFWYADNGNDSWTYSTSGAMDLEPQAGSVEYWVFGGASGAGQPPGPTPAMVRNATDRSAASTTTVPAPTATEPSAAAAATGGTNSGPAPKAQTTSPAGQASSAAPTTTMPTRTPAPGAPTSGSSAVTSHPSSDSASAGSSRGRTPPTVSGHTKGSERSGTGFKIISVAPALARQPTGSPLGLILGGIAVAALAGMAGFIALRRRRGG
jgi:hypothetical protein